ncbi:MAG TPA: M17 family peptidase N-terminal domain-containing protein, partial [Gemmatimonadales bacterium]|nr:M17 family peptidase N-terminal domain-containing protein [Gemmatimonadales bacterium]
MSLETAVLVEAPASHSTPLLMLAVPQSGLPASLAELDQRSGGALTRLYATGDFTGKRDEIAIIYPDGPAAKVLLVGMGKVTIDHGTAIRRAAAVAAKRAKNLGVAEASFWVAPEASGEVDAAAVVRGAAEGLPFGAWQYLELKRPAEDRRPPLERVRILAPAGAAEVDEGHRIGAAIAAGQALARGIQVLPGNDCTPSFLGREAEAIGQRHGIAVTVLDRAAIVEEKMGALLAVAQGSDEEPRFIALDYAGADGAPIVLIGKGVTFD